MDSQDAIAIGLCSDALRAVVGTGFHVRPHCPMAIDDDSEPEPDLVVVSGGPRDYPELHPATAARVVEVAGMARGFERKHKGNLYARASIPDYWVLNLVQRVLEVYRSPVPNTATPLGYSCRERLRLTEEDSITSLAFPSASIAVADLLP